MATNKYDKPTYAYTAGVGKMADDNFDIKGATNSEAEMRFSDVPDQKAMRYMAADEKLSEFLNPKAGAGRGKQGGPTAKELQKYEDKKDARIFTKEKRMPPSPREMASGGKVSSASKRADGCATKGKTKGTMITMYGGGKC
jgi:hypothetical protein